MKISKKQEINKLIEELKPYAIAHEYYFAGLFKIGARKYNEIIKNLAKGMIESIIESNEYRRKYYQAELDRYFNKRKNFDKCKIRDLALDFQLYLNAICDSPFRTATKNAFYRQVKINDGKIERDQFFKDNYF